MCTYVCIMQSNWLQGEIPSSEVSNRTLEQGPIRTLDGPLAAEAITIFPINLILTIIIIFIIIYFVQGNTKIYSNHVSSISILLSEMHFIQLAGIYILRTSRITHNIDKLLSDFLKYSV